MIEEGRPAPFWDNRPQIPPDLMWVWHAWEELRTCRGYHMGGGGPIPWTAIHEWARHNRLTQDEEEDLTQGVWAIDAEIMKD